MNEGISYRIVYGDGDVCDSVHTLTEAFRLSQECANDSQVIHHVIRVTSNMVASAYPRTRRRHPTETENTGV